MNCPSPDMVGSRFGRLVVLEQLPREKGQELSFLCVCDCGNETIVRQSKLKNGKTRSCGCLARETARNLMTTHGGHGTRLYEIWAGMRKRCSNPNSTYYRRYGGRGITVCKEWNDSFDAFREWAVKNGYRDSLTLDRINVDGNYCPENCRWATWKEQQRNKSNNVLYECEGVKLTLAEWAEKKQISYRTLHDRIKARGWSVEKAITTPARKLNRKAVTHDAS